MSQWIVERVTDEGGKAVNPYMRYANRAGWERLVGPYWDVWQGEYSCIAVMDDFGNLVDVKEGTF